MSALATDHGPNVAVPARGGSSDHVAVPSTRKLLAVIVAVEAVYAALLVLAIPYGAGAVALAIALSCLLAFWARGRLDRETAQIRARRVHGESRSA